MSNYIYDLVAGNNAALAANATAKGITEAVTTQNWTVNAKSVATVTTAGSTVTIDSGKTVVVNGNNGIDTIILNNTVKDATATITGGTGADVITVTDGAATIYGGAGIDAITVNTTVQSDAVTINGGAESDTIVLGAKATNVKNTIIYDGLDKITANIDSRFVLNASDSTKAVAWDLSKMTTGTATAAEVLKSGIVVEGTSAVDVKNISGLVGTALADTLTAGSEAVTLDGGAGADTLIATAAGTTFVYDAADAKVTGNASTLTAAGKTTAMNLSLEKNTVFTGIASVIGSDVADNIHGTGTVTITGGKGDDLIWGGSTASITGTNTFGDNTLTGGAGADEFWIGYNEGNDSISYDVTAETTTADYSKNDIVHLYNVSAYDIIGEGVFINTAAGSKIKYASLANNNTNTLTLTGAAGKTDAVRHFTSQEGWSFDVAFAGAADTKLTGTAGVTDNLVAYDAVGVTLDGQGGNDNLYGNSGNDTFVFHAGDQIYSGGGTDTIDASQATAGATIFTADLLAGKTPAADWTINGSKFDDNIRGTAVEDTIIAGDGNDAIWGGAGVQGDTLTGGRGVDTYYYGLDEGNDTIVAGGSKYDGNALDTVNFYNVAKTDDLSAVITGDDLVISVTGAQGVGKLTLDGWAATDGLNKLTNVVVADTNYTMGYDTATDKVTFTKTVA